MLPTKTLSRIPGVSIASTLLLLLRITWSPNTPDLRSVVRFHFYFVFPLSASFVSFRLIVELSLDLTSYQSHLGVTSSGTRFASFHRIKHFGSARYVSCYYVSPLVQSCCLFWDEWSCVYYLLGVLYATRGGLVVSHVGT